MRVVNMAHGSFYLLGGYIAYEMQQEMTGQGFSLARHRGEHLGVGAAGARRGRRSIGVVGLVVQQVFLRWNQGQELRQALITIAISVIVADQVIAHFNDGIASTRDLAGLDEPARRAAAARDRLLARAPARARPRRRGRRCRSGCGSTGRGPAW